MKRPRGCASAIVTLVAVSATACSLFLSTDELSGAGASAAGDAAANDAPANGGRSDAPDSEAFNIDCDAPGLVAAWQFEEAQGGSAADCTGHGLDALLYDGAGWGPGRDGGAALLLAPNAYAEVQNASLLRQGGAFSVTAWVLVRSDVLDGRIFASSHPTNPGFDLTFETGPRSSDGRINFLSLITAVTLPGGGFDTPSADSRTIALEQWTHVAGVYDGDSTALYLDGEFQERKRVGARRVADEPVYIGRRSSTNCCFFDGYIDELRYYDRPLADAEVRALAAR